MTAVRHAAVYGEVDPNLVDGSSVWLQSICQVLASIEGVHVTLLLRRPLEPARRFLLDELEADAGIDVVDPGRPELLAPAQALDLLERIDCERGPFDLLLLRGGSVLVEAAERSAFDGRLWAYAMPGHVPDETLRSVAASSARVLCQTDAAAEEMRRLAPDANGRVTVLPPMIPDFAPHARRDGAGEGSLRLVYSGKLAPEYCWLETLSAFRALRERAPGAELHVLGDKIHRPPDQPEFHETASRALRETEGLRWHGAVPRAAVHDLLTDCDLALSIRDPTVEAARELSTKVLEYGAAGLPVVLNRAPAYERLLGEDYPLFVDGPAEATDLLTGPALDPDMRAAAAAACGEAGASFTYARGASRLRDFLPAEPTVDRQPDREAGSSIHETLTGLLDALLAGNVAKDPTEIVNSIARQADDPAYLASVARFVFHVWSRFCRAPEKLDHAILRELALRSTSTDSVPADASAALEYLALWAEADSYIRDNYLRGVHHRHFFADDRHREALRKTLGTRASESRTDYPKFMFEGILASIDDRPAAAKLFHAAREANPKLATASALDHFAATYFSAEELADRNGELRQRRAELLADFDLIGRPEGSSDSSLLLFSCDPVFFAVYFPYWASVAEYLREYRVGMHFVLVGERREVNTAMRRAQEITEAVSRLRSFRPAPVTGNISFSSIRIPAWVASPKSFFASARYLFGRVVADSFPGKVFILDIDMSLRSDPSPFLHRIGMEAETRIPVAISRGLPSLIAARRYGAATFCVGRSGPCADTIRHVEEYVLAGLSQPDSWTLDQNAITYAIEQVDAALGSDVVLGFSELDTPRPFAQEPVRQIYEGRQRLQQGHRS